MLKRLYIKDFVLIEEMDFSLSEGFNVITGETGAGKSIIMGALALVMGVRAETKSVRDGAKKCVVEATFGVEKYGLQSFFEENAMDYETECVIRREIMSDGTRSRAFVNDSPVTLDVLKMLTERLIDIHSQHANLQIRDPFFQLSVLDVVGETTDDLSAYQIAFEKWKSAMERLKRLKNQREKAAKERDFYEYQLAQLQAAELKEGEQEDLESEQQILLHTEDIKVALNQSVLLLNNDHSGIVMSLKNAASGLQKIKTYDNDIELFFERLNSAYIELKDLAQELERKDNLIEYNPTRLQWIDERLNVLYSLEKKFSVDSLTQLIEKEHEIEQLLKTLDSNDEELIRLEKEVETLFDDMKQLSEKLTLRRQQSTTIVERYLVEQLNLLGMNAVRFDLRLSESEEYTSLGHDVVEYYFSANEKSQMQPVGLIASGGEIARIMLCLKALLAQTKALPTIVFDEVDTGISGEVADKTGDIMRKMANEMQVICITHLPQIAVKGTAHHQVFKLDSTTQIKTLSSDERVMEIAQMLSGASLSDAAIANAKQLLGLSAQ